MSENNTDRREFLKLWAAGAAAVSAGVVGCEAPESAALAFEDAWRATGPGGPATGPADAGLSQEDGRWQVVRDQFLLEPGYTYMNTAGLGPTPRPVMSALMETWERLEQRCETGHGERAGVRATAASFLGCDEDELAFVRSATEGMNLVARGLDLSPDDEVVMTTHEHPGGAMPWFGIREGMDAGIRTFEPGVGGQDTLEKLAAALTPRTRVVMVSHITCTTGLILPVPEIAALCRDRGIVCVIDGAQAPGQIPVDLHALGCDFYVASGHKWLLGPKGTGFLFIRDEWLDRWRPSYVGAYSDAGFDLASGRFERLRPASASEYGTRSTPLLLGFQAAFELLSTMDMETVAARGRHLALGIREGLAGMDGVDLLTPEDAGASILTFRLPISGGDPWEWLNRLRADHGIRLRPVGEAGLNAVRASTHVFNTEAEVSRLLDVLGSVV